jgi:hypothetical protein
MKPKIDKAFYEQVLMEYEKGEVDSIYICPRSKLFKEAWIDEIVRDEIKKQAYYFLKSQEYYRITIGLISLFYFQEEVDWSEREIFRIEFLQYMINEYNWQENETAT